MDKPTHPIFQPGDGLIQFTLSLCQTVADAARPFSLGGYVLDRWQTDATR